MEYIVIAERNHNDKTVFHFCRWNGNEEALKKLMKIMDDADYVNWEDGEYVFFQYTEERIRGTIRTIFETLAERRGARVQTHNRTFRMIEDSEIHNQGRETWEENCADFLQDYWKEPTQLE